MAQLHLSALKSQIRLMAMNISACAFHTFRPGKNLCGLLQETQKVIDGELHDEDAESMKVLQDDLEAAHREVSLAEVC